GLLRTISGKITIDGTNLFSLTQRQIARKIAYVPQMFNLAFEFSVNEIVYMGRYAHQRRLNGGSLSDKRIVNEVMELTGISHLTDKKIAHLSGGERQRVFIARALAQDTPLLFLDEPSSHLDINYQVEIYKILKFLQEEKGKTILSTEHNINLVIPYAHRLIFLKDGKLYGQGPPEKLITKSNIKDVFDANVDIRKNIHSQLPEISLIPQKAKNQ
ncbi:MAG: ABC transporter ATP-binding protein, partial [Acidobacteriota bacterium]|nr:ABC transporter ATP-binding protein [Acidobacteriota bacterium]